MIKGKKGLGMRFIIELALLAVGIIVISFFVSDFGSLIASSGKASSCSLSLIGGKGTANCPVKKAIILTDKVEVEGTKFMDKPESGAQEMAKEAIARLLSSCLSTGGGYNSRAFSGENYVSNEVVCLECYKLNIDKNVGNIGGLTDYLRDTKPKSRISDKKYLESLTRDQHHLKAYMEYGLAKRLAPSSGTFIFNPETEYTIFFMGIKKGEIPTIWQDVKEFFTFDFTEFVRTNDAYFVYAAESGRIQQVCGRKVN